MTSKLETRERNPISDIKAFTAPFNNMLTLKFEAQPTNTFFATVNQMYRRLLPASDNNRERGNQNQIVDHGSDNIVGNWEEPPNIGLTVAKNAFVG